MTQTSDSRTQFKRWVALDKTSGALLLVAAVLAVVWANSPWQDAYQSLTSFEFGPEALHLHLSLAEWAADGLLAIFFFVVGVELKQEFVAGSLRDLKLAGVPIAAAVGGMIVPALCYVAIVASAEPSALKGWAIPTATDIAFALAVLAIFGRGLPMALRTFLLTLAVVDDLLGIIVIATVYTEEIDFVMLGAALVVIAIFGVLVRMPKPQWKPLIPIVLIPVAVLAWGLMHASGVHATVAGVLLGFTVPALLVHGETSSRTHQCDDAVRPVSSAIALPIFAFLSAGVAVIGGDSPILEPVSIGVFVGLTIGKVIGVLGATTIMTRVTPLRLPDAIGLRDLLPIGMLTGVGFTVSLLIAELSFKGSGEEHTSPAKAAVLAGSVVAAICAAALLRWDAHKLRDRDMNCDGVVDVDIARIGD